VTKNEKRIKNKKGGTIEGFWSIKRGESSKSSPLSLSLISSSFYNISPLSYAINNWLLPLKLFHEEEKNEKRRMKQENQQKRGDKISPP